MPLPSASLRHFLGGLSEEEALTNALTASLAEDFSGGEDDAAGATPAAEDGSAMPHSGISFAKMTAMGFAATGTHRQAMLLVLDHPNLTGGGRRRRVCCNGQPASVSGLGADSPCAFGVHLMVLRASAVCGWDITQHVALSLLSDMEGSHAPISSQGQACLHHLPAQCLAQALARGLRGASSQLSTLPSAQQCQPQSPSRGASRPRSSRALGAPLQRSLLPSAGWSLLHCLLMARCALQ